jgi:glycosyltransferase involved in cell wall biosynthesis
MVGQTIRDRSPMNAQPPLVSVCLPVYNAERYLADAVGSIRNQTFGDFEFLIIDDGSTDGSTKILKHHAAHDPRIRLTIRPNKGLVATLNELIDQAQGELIARMDADDIAMPERFQKQVDYLRAHPECVEVGCRVKVIDADGDPLGDWWTLVEHEAIDAQHFQVGQGAALAHPSAMMRRDAVLAIGKYRDFSSSEDLDLHLRLAEHGRLANLPQILLKYRIHDANRTTSAFTRDRQYRDYRVMVRDACQRRNMTMEAPPNPPVNASSEAIGDHDEAFLWWALRSGHPSTARKYAWRILAKAPLSISSWKNVYCSIRGC